MMPSFKTGYYYLHVNGQLIYKPSIVVESDPDYFDSTFVQRVWKIDTEDQHREMIQEVERITHASWLNKNREKKWSRNI